MTTLELAGSPLWYASRSSGTLALLLLTTTVILGTGFAGRAAPRRIGRFELALLHRNLSLLTLAFLVVHAVTAILDPFVHLSWAVSMVPFVASYRPLWLGLGTTALDLLLAVLLTSALRLRIGARLWKAVHWTAYAAWPLALFHSVGTGTDTRLSLQLWLYAGCVAAVVGTVWWRLAKAGPGAGIRRSTAALAAAAVPMLLTAFLAAGPLRPGWAHRAATLTITLGGGL
ncbi:ferric reductase-like transmembrane domain-containing protein [Nocardia seriolae]|uniref:Ferric oxidoreductase domain-containing protein n=1 Tax=Nocardia seriolae TaxID=37332 RepID=A0A0B8N8R6_9NOCA|nr:ferric reductase-like transmembrane domain-containing protein [Nocardia seriolae]MTJ61574.1 ferric reductase [Nocardia seriolae]MTJ71541.1 ferric reductase [Nocardia seriolae]MTJ86594.1 ferric reductase [Nocardia seriolae]MTK30589.1 ferric reductase [Nocardia seriolae]MTK39542.1 ferric reductase [Nocardia seriolae]